MRCPYCKSDVDDTALICKTCLRDLSLVSSLTQKVSELETRLRDFPDREAYEQRINELEHTLSLNKPKDSKSNQFSFLAALADVGVFILIPFALLLLAHFLVTVVYDAKMTVLLIVSLLLPLPFGFFLLGSHQRNFFIWVLGVTIMSIATVLGMSVVTGTLDDSHYFPKTMFEWREVLAYAASIGFSYFTGMLLGKLHFARRFANASNEAAGKHINVQEMAKSIQDILTAGAAIVTTIIAIFTGLKSLL